MELVKKNTIVKHTLHIPIEFVTADMLPPEGKQIFATITYTNGAEHGDPLRHNGLTIEWTSNLNLVRRWIESGEVKHQIYDYADNPNATI